MMCDVPREHYETILRSILLLARMEGDGVRERIVTVAMGSAFR